MDRQTDGIAMAYTRYGIYAVARKKLSEGVNRKTGPLLLYFCPYSPAIGTGWYKWTFYQQTMCVLLDCAVRIETGSSYNHDY